MKEQNNIPTLELIGLSSGALIGPFVLIGIFFSGLYGCLHVFDLDFATRKESVDFIYFSFVTLTTLGYGEITPTSEIGKYLTILESIIGIFYMGVVVSFTLSNVIEGTNRQ